MSKAKYNWTSQNMSIIDETGKQVACTFSWVGSVEKAHEMAAWIAAAPKKIANLEAQIKALRDGLLEVRAIQGCSPKTPWHGCTEQTVSNLEHYDGHAFERAKVLGAALATTGEGQS